MKNRGTNPWKIAQKFFFHQTQKPSRITYGHPQKIHKEQSLKKLSQKLNLKILSFIIDLTFNGVSNLNWEWAKIKELKTHLYLIEPFFKVTFFCRDYCKETSQFRMIRLHVESFLFVLSMAELIECYESNAIFMWLFDLIELYITEKFSRISFIIGALNLIHHSIPNNF